MARIHWTTHVITLGDPQDLLMSTARVALQVETQMDVQSELLVAKALIAQVVAGAMVQRRNIIPFQMYPLQNGVLARLWR